MENLSEADVAAPRRKITAALVVRVAGRVENGLPLKVALAGEGIIPAAIMLSCFGAVGGTRPDVWTSESVVIALVRRTKHAFYTMGMHLAIIPRK